MPLYTFKCDKGHTCEIITPSDWTEHACMYVVDPHGPRHTEMVFGIGVVKEQPIYCGRPAARIEEPEVPAWRNPVYGIQR